MSDGNWISPLPEVRLTDANAPAATETVGREMFLDLLDRLPQAVVILDEGGRVRFWSAGATALFGYSREEMIGRDAGALLPQSRVQAGEPARLLTHARDGGELRDFETERLTRDGRQIAVLLTQSPIRGQEGAFRGSLQCLTDISEHRSLLRTLERRVHQLSIIKEIGEALHSTMDLDEILQLILIGVTAGPGLRFNRAFLLLADEGASRLDGRLAIGPADADDARRIWAEMAQRPMTLRQMLRKYERSLAETNVRVNQLVSGMMLQLGDESSVLVRAIRGGSALTITQNELSPSDRDLADRLGSASFAIAPLSARGRAIGALLADNVITGREIHPDDLEMLQLLAATASIAIDNSRLYAELARRLALLETARAEARRSQQAVMRAERLSAIGEMAATVAHDIRNPLVAIGGFARALSSHPASDESAREYLNIILDEVTRLERIVTKVLDSARPAPTVAQPVQINLIVVEAVKLLEGELAKANVKVVMRLDSGLPAIPADSDRILQMVLNLMRNAVQAMPVSGTLSILTLPAGEWVEMRFTDSGHGIAPEIRDRIFSPFFTTKSAGSGLGLTIVNQVVREHGGVLDLQSTVGAGSTFTVKLPLKKSEDNHDQDSRS